MAKAEEPSMLGFAKYLLRGRKLEGEETPNKKVVKQTTVEEAPLGSGMAGQAATALKSRKQQIDEATGEYKKGGKVKAKCMARGGGIESRGKTRGRFV